ncbi:MAG: hypothetical protein V6Z89_17810 [Desulfobacter sp.]
MESLITSLQSDIKNHYNGIQPTAIIIDDDWDEEIVFQPVSWNTFVNDLEEEYPDIYNSLIDFLEEKRSGIDEPLIETLWFEFKSEYLSSDDEQLLDIVNNFESKKNDLHELKGQLEEIGFSVKCFDRPPTNEELIKGNIFFLDYQMKIERNQGETATSTLKALIDNYNKKELSHIPLTVLMSKNIKQSDSERWGGIAKKAGFFRLNYNFLNKNHFVANKSILSLLLKDMLSFQPVAKAYYKQMHRVQEISKSLIDEAILNLFQVTPSEVNLFRTRIKNEGTSISQYFLDLFSDYLKKEIKVSDSVSEAMDSFDEVTNAAEIIPPIKMNRGELLKLSVQTMYTQETLCEKEPSFGDIYQVKDQSDRYLLVISQECDLINSESRQAINNVLCLNGVKTQDSKNQQGNRIIVKPWMEKEKLYYMKWDTINPCIVFYDAFQNDDGFIKKCQLRKQDAESIQQVFANSITRVGTDITPEPLNYHKGRLFEDQDGKPVDLNKSISICENNGQLAIVPNYNDLYNGVADEFFPYNEIEQLTQFKPFDEFKNRIEKIGIKAFIAENNDGLVLYKSKNNNLRSLKTLKKAAMKHLR